MVNYYQVKCTTYVDGKEKSVHSFCTLLNEKKHKKKK